MSCEDATRLYLLTRDESFIPLKDLGYYLRRNYGYKPQEIEEAIAVINHPMIDHYGNKYIKTRST